MPYRFGKLHGGERAIKGCSSPQTLEDPFDILEFQNLNSVIINPGSDNRPHAVVSVLGNELTALLDSGANCSLLGGKMAELAEKLGLQKGRVTGGIKTADGTRHMISNYVYLPIVYNNHNEVIAVLLVPSISDCVILGMNF